MQGGAEAFVQSEYISLRHAMLYKRKKRPHQFGRNYLAPPCFYRRRRVIFLLFEFGGSF